MRAPIALAVLSFAAASAFAHEGATGVVKERMDMMKNLGATLKSLSVMVRNGDHDSALVRKAGQDIQRHATHFPEMFPVGSDAAPSEADPAIWERKEAFNALFDEMGKAAAVLERSARHPGMTKAQVMAIQVYCRECHDDFRVKR